MASLSDALRALNGGDGGVVDFCFDDGMCVPITRRDQIQGELARLGIVDFFVPMTPLGLATEIAMAGGGTLIFSGGRFLVRIGSNYRNATPDEIARAGGVSGGIGGQIRETLLDVPGRVQTRINLANGSTRFTPLNDAGNPVASGWDHVVARHFGGTNTQSQFTLPQSEVREILRSNRVVSALVTEVKMINGTPSYVRTVDVGRIVGTIRQSQGGATTSRILIQTDSAGNLITAYPVP